MSSDEVNSIGDSTESRQVAEIIRQKYLDIINRVSLPEHEQLIQLVSSTDTDLPVLMYVPEGVGAISWLKYYNSNVLDSASTTSTHDVNTDLENNSGSGLNPPPGYEYVTILPVRQFVDYVGGYNPEESDVETWTFTDASHGFPGVYTFNYKTLQQPTYACIINNYYVIFDSYDSTQDSTLQSSKTMAWGRITPVFKMEDTFIPDLAEEQFQLLLNEAKALAFFELKQQPHQLAIQETKRGWSNVQKNKAVANRPTYFNELPDYGRGSRGGWGTATSYFKQRGFDR